MYCERGCDVVVPRSILPTDRITSDFMIFQHSPILRDFIVGIDLQYLRQRSSEGLKLLRMN